MDVQSHQGQKIIICNGWMNAFFIFQNFNIATVKNLVSQASCMYNIPDCSIQMLNGVGFHCWTGVCLMITPD